MQTELADFVRGRPAGREAEAILRKCVHCGFCNATCPTYRLLGDELDGPRGRIYLIKQLLEGEEVGAKTRLHLDRCLTCRACETTCPSGVEYGRLADLGRQLLEERAPRRGFDRLRRAVLSWVLPRGTVFKLLLGLGRLVKPLLPGKVREIVPSPPPPAGVWPAVRHARRMLTLAGCVQPALAPRTNAAAARVLDRLGISLQEMRAPCCGALRFHLGRQDAGLDDARGVIDTLWAQVATGTVEAIVMTASGCGAMVRDYARLLSSDRIYAERAARISALCRDLSEVVDAERTALAALVLPAHDRAADAPIVVHSPCTLQHAQRLEGLVERVLECTGRPLTRAADPDQCCGSAGTYSIVQPQLARTLRGRKLAALEGSRPAVIATANVGCQHHLQAGTATPVCHWIELVDEALAR